jgi:hypothetical protein
MTEPGSVANRRACIGLCEPACSSCGVVQTITAKLSPTTEIKSGLCATCGAPFVVDAAIDRAVCALCSASIALPVRMSPAELAQAIASLAGAETRSELRYDLLRRPTLEPDLADSSAEEPATVGRLCTAFIGARSEPSHFGSGYRASADREHASDEEQLRVWIALRLVEVLGHRGLWLLARPFLETIVDSAKDDGHRYLAYAALSRVALASGDAVAAERWLEFCSPDPRWLALRAVALERRVSVALARADWESARALTADRDAVPLAWPERLRLDLARVVLAERSSDEKLAVASMRAALEAHLASDIEDALRREDVLSPARLAWDRIRALDKRQALRSVRGALIFSGLLFVAGAIGMVFAPSVVMTCELSAERAERTERTASCAIEKNLLGLGLGRRVVAGVRGAEREPAGKNSYRFALQTPSGLDAPDSIASPDSGMRVDTLKRFLTDPDPNHPKLTMVWDHALALAAGATALVASVLMLGYAGVRRARIELDFRG